MPTKSGLQSRQQRGRWLVPRLYADYLRLGIFAGLLLGLSIALSYGLDILLNYREFHMQNYGPSVALSYGLHYGLSIGLSFSIIGITLQPHFLTTAI